MKVSTRTFHAGFFVAACAVASCASDVKSTTETTAASKAGVTAELQTFVNKSLEIDQIGSGPGDANLYVGNDPADGSASRQFPTGGPSTWIDWHDLGNDLANHRVQDLDVSGKDPTSFPQSNECVGTSSVLSKMDLTYIGASSNSTYAYFAVQRSNNNGDAGYYWLFTKVEPSQTTDEAPCDHGKKRLTYDLSVGDILLSGHFHPNGSPLLTVYRSKVAASHVSAVNAIDYTATAQWELQQNAVAAATVNTTVTAPGSFGSAGVIGLSGANLDTEIFAEAAVNMNVFTGGGSSCGASFYGSVITRSSGSGGTSPDLKDLAGPAKFNFGSVSLTATLTGGCDGKLGFGVSGTQPDGNAIDFANATCSWSITNGTNTYTSSSCSSGANPISVVPGNYTGTVTVTAAGCSGTASGTGEVLTPLTVSLTRNAAAPTCPSMSSDAVTWSANVSGGKGPYTYTWTPATCSGTSCTVDPSDSSFCVSQDVQVTVSDSSGGTCANKTSEKETYTKVTTITASDN